MTHYQGGKKEKKKSININTPSAVIAKTDPISTSCSQPASTRITPALMHHTACTRVHASGWATPELSQMLSKCPGGWQHLQQMLWQLYRKQRQYFSIFILKKKCMKALRQPEEQHPLHSGTSLTLWPSRSCDRKINSSVARDWGLALRQVSLQSSEQR